MKIRSGVAALFATRGNETPLEKNMQLPLLDLSFLNLLPDKTSTGPGADDEPAELDFPPDLVSAWDHAFKTYGFAYVKIPESLTALYRRLARRTAEPASGEGDGGLDECQDETSEAAERDAAEEKNVGARTDLFFSPLDEFFLGCSNEEKMQYCLGKGYGLGGYVPRGVETVAKSSVLAEGDTGSGVGGKKRVLRPDPVETLCLNAWKEEFDAGEMGLVDVERKNIAAGESPPLLAAHGAGSFALYPPSERTIPISPFPREQTGYRSDELLDLTRSLWRQLDSLLQKVMELSATALQLRGEARESFLEGFREGKASNVLRYARYFDEDVHQEQGGEDGSGAQEGPHQSPPAVDERLLYGPHTDYTGFTFLWRSGENGLQCLGSERSSRSSKSGDEQQTQLGCSSCSPAAASTTALLQRNKGLSWVDVHNNLGDDVIVVNAGDLLQRWTNDYWLSNLHRVTGPRGTRQRGGSAPQVGGERGASDAHRGEHSVLYSIVFFTGPHDDTVMRPLRSSELIRAFSDENGIDENKYPVTTSGAHLLEKILKSNQ
ncbi:unnamed protein product [Amoebophrya sp. A120]|nr:unnamed protein product [Amoebophrya sp. A120]|eukprot:GSA120T00017250001.1